MKMKAAYMANNYGMARTARNIMLGLAAATIIGTTTACGALPTTLNSQEFKNQAAQVYMVEGTPLSAASNCFGHGMSFCNLAVVVQDKSGQKKALVSSQRSDNQAEITKLEAVIQAEVSDQDAETIQVALDTDYNIKAITVEGKTYQP
jgi:hypothetical protein